LAAAGVGIGFPDRGLALAQRLHLAARKRDAGFEHLADLIVEARLAVVGDDLLLAVRFRRHCRTPAAARSPRVCVWVSRDGEKVLPHIHLLCAFKRSRISVRSSSCLVGAAGFAASARSARFISRTTRKRTHAMMMKLMVMVRKFPQASTAPCFLASISESAVTFDESRTK